MDYIIFDLEWNQPSSECAAVMEPVYLTGEIIEIGAVKLNEDFQKVDELRLYVAPKYYTKMHRKVASLTGIHDRDLAGRGVPFPEVFRQFSDWCGPEFCYMTWSMSDLPMLVENMQLHGISTENLPDCCDIQRIFLREILRSDRRVSLDHALEILGIQGDTAHDALNDSRNTALVCDRLDLNEYISEYVGAVFAFAPITKAYESPRAVLEDSAITDFSCPWCGKPVTAESWLRYSADTYMTMASCADGDELFLYLEIAQHASADYRAKLLVYEMTDDLYEVYQDTVEEAAAKA